MSKLVLGFELKWSKIFCLTRNILSLFPTQLIDCGWSLTCSCTPQFKVSTCICPTEAMVRKQQPSKSLYLLKSQTWEPWRKEEKKRKKNVVTSPRRKSSHDPFRTHVILQLSGSSTVLWQTLSHFDERMKFTWVCAGGKRVVCEFSKVFFNFVNNLVLLATGYCRLTWWTFMQLDRCHRFAIARMRSKIHNFCEFVCFMQTTRVQNSHDALVWLLWQSSAIVRCFPCLAHVVGIATVSTSEYTCRRRVLENDDVLENELASSNEKREPSDQSVGPLDFWIYWGW